MTITIDLDLTPEQERELRREARGKGLPVADYVVVLLQKHLPRPDSASSGVRALDPDDRAGEFQEWAATHQINNPQIEEEVLRQKLRKTPPPPGGSSS